MVRRPIQPAVQKSDWAQQRSSHRFRRLAKKLATATVKAKRRWASRRAMPPLMAIPMLRRGRALATAMLQRQQQSWMSPGQASRPEKPPKRLHLLATVRYPLSLAFRLALASMPLQLARYRISPCRAEATLAKYEWDGAYQPLACSADSSTALLILRSIVRWGSTSTHQPLLAPRGSGVEACASFCLCVAVFAPLLSLYDATCRIHLDVRGARLNGP